MTNLPPKKSTVYRNSGVWLKLKQLGYDVIPLARGKAFPFKGWPKTPNDTAEIMNWSGRSAGIRNSGSDALVVDLDTCVPEALAAIIAMMTQRWPEFMAGCLRRHSGAVKLALIGRCLDPPPGPMATARYYPPGHTDEKAFVNRVEIFHKHVGTRYVAVHGMHSPGREYGYYGRSILDVPLSELPVFPGKDIGALADACEKIMAGLGYDSDLAGALRGMSEVTVYDLTPELMFRLKEGHTVSLDKLGEDVRRDGKHEGYASIWDAGTDCPDRVKANWSAEGLSLWDSHTQIRHRMVGAERPKEMPNLTAFAVLIEGLTGEPSGEPSGEPAANLPPTSGEPAADLPPTSGEPTGPDREPDREPAAEAPLSGEPPQPPFYAPLADKVKWLVATRAYCETLDRVVRLYCPSEEGQSLPAAFNRAHYNWSEMSVPGPGSGKPKLQFAVAQWWLHPQRLALAGVRMRPDRPFPTYVEGAATFKNTYQAPAHVGDGDINPWLEFMSHLLPADIERDYCLDWLAHKVQHLDIPSVCLVMVAVNERGDPVYGCGRGILFEILAKVFGRRYVKPIDFDVFSGRSAQGVYTDWSAYALLVVISEARDNAEAGRWTERRAVYERIKEIIDPRPVTRTFTSKGRPAFEAMSYASHLIASNNNDAFQLPENDRRIAVLRNGTKLPKAQTKVITAWMKVPGNIAALWRWLKARDVTGFDAYTPLHTQAKAAMQELARGPIADWIAELYERLGRDALFTEEMLMKAIGLEAGDRMRAMESAVRAELRRRIKTPPSLVKRPRMPRDPMHAQHGIRCWWAYLGPTIGNIGVAQECVRHSEAVLFAEPPPATAAPTGRLGLHAVSTGGGAAAVPQSEPQGEPQE